MKISLLLLNIIFMASNLFGSEKLMKPNSQKMIRAFLKNPEKSLLELEKKTLSFEEKLNKEKKRGFKKK